MWGTALILYLTPLWYYFSYQSTIEIVNGSIGRAITETMERDNPKTIANYIDSKKGSCKVYPAPFAVKPFEDDDKTVVEPDISVICDPNKLTDRGCTGAPDWIVEIVSPSNSSHDYIRKLNLYADAAVREYWIVNPDKKSIYVYHLEETQFETTAYSFQDKIKVNIYDDLSIDFSELVLWPFPQGEHIVLSLQSL